MKRIWTTPYLGLLARLVIGFLFVYASIDKIADPDAFTTSIANYRLTNPGLTILAATIIPWIELLTGLLLLGGLLVRASGTITLALLVLFTGAIITGLARGLDITCGCFTQDPAVGKIGWLKVAENAGLILLNIMLLLVRRSRYTIEEYVTRNAGTREPQP